MVSNRSPKVKPGRGWNQAYGLIHYSRGSAGILLFISAISFVEAYIAFPATHSPQWAVAAYIASRYFLPAFALGAIALLAGASQRLFGWPQPPVEPAATKPVVQTDAQRRSSRAFTLVAGYFGLGILAIIIMADTHSGPFAWFAEWLFGANFLLWPEIFVMGLLVLAAPLVLLAWLPPQTWFPLLASMQDIVTPAPTPVSRRRKR